MTAFMQDIDDICENGLDLKHSFAMAKNIPDTAVPPTTAEISDDQFEALKNNFGPETMEFVMIGLRENGSGQRKQTVDVLNLVSLKICTKMSFIFMFMFIFMLNSFYFFFNRQVF